MTEQLKPCPFCGGEAYIEQPGTRRQSCIVECGSCGLRHDSGDEGDRCGTSWNRRALESRVLAERKPVAWRVHPFDYGIGHEGVYAMTMRDEQVLMWERKGWKVEPLFTHPTPDDASDAARYRWLKANCYDTEEAGDGDSFAHPSLVFESDKLAAYSPESLDAAIDAAMKEQKESGT